MDKTIIRLIDTYEGQLRFRIRRSWAII